jgi:hypothetical protein
VTGRGSLVSLRDRLVGGRVLQTSEHTQRGLQHKECREGRYEPISPFHRRFTRATPVYAISTQFRRSYIHRSIGRKS